MSQVTAAAGNRTPLPLDASRINALAAIGAGLFLLGFALWLGQTVSARQGVLFLIGGALGFSLLHAAFGFTAAFRDFLTAGRGRGIRAQMLMLGLAVLLFFPVLAAGDVFGQPVNGILFSVGTAVVAGAFLFGIGMQVAGACASGSLFAAGTGSPRMLVVILFFIVGSVLGAAHLPAWQSLPRMETVSLIGSLGWIGALAFSLAVFAAVYAATLWLERARHGAVRADAAPAGPFLNTLLRGPWPLWWGAVALALLNFATLLVSGRPWGITDAFTLWGSQALLPLHPDLLFWDYWADSRAAAALETSALHDQSTVMNIGLVAGAVLAAGLSGKFSPTLRIAPAALLAAALGGLLLGYGARIGTGCNISAYFGGIASGSLHGWVWLPAALAGNWIGLKLRAVLNRAD